MKTAEQTTRYIRKHNDPFVLIWTVALSKRPDMIECDAKGNPIPPPIVPAVNTPPAPKPAPDAPSRILPTPEQLAAKAETVAKVQAAAAIPETPAAAADEDGPAVAEVDRSTWTKTHWRMHARELGLNPHSALSTSQIKKMVEIKEAELAAKTAAPAAPVPVTPTPEAKG